MNELTKEIDMKKLIVVLLLLAFAVSGFTQEKLGEESAGLHAVFAVAPVALPFDGGEAKFLSSKPMAGVGYTFTVLGLDVTPAGFLSGEINIDNGEKENWTLDLSLGVIGWKGAVAGINWQFAREGAGVQGVKKSSLSFMLGYNFKTL